MSIGWTDLGGALLLGAIGILILAGIIGLLAWAARRRGSTTVLIDVTSTVARMWVAIMVLGAVLLIVRWFGAGFTEISAMPVVVTWPTSLPCQEAGEVISTAPALSCASISSVDATVTNLGIAPRLVLLLGELLAVVLAALPGVVVAVICGAVRTGHPFSPVTSRWLVIAAVVVLVAGLGAAFATSIGATMAAAEVLPPPGHGPATSPAVFRVGIPLWPIGGALALGALAAVFRHGTVLQRETEGLV